MVPFLSVLVLVFDYCFEVGVLEFQLLAKRFGEFAHPEFLDKRGVAPKYGSLW